MDQGFPIDDVRNRAHPGLEGCASPMSLPSEILVVDDDAAVCTFMQHALEGRGYHVWTAHSGSEALTVLDQRGRDLRLLLTDVIMPDMTGPALATAAGRALPGLRVLYVSGYRGAYSDQVPAAVCLEKPFTATQLLERVQALIASDEDTSQVH